MELIVSTYDPRHVILTQICLGKWSCILDTKSIKKAQQALETHLKSLRQRHENELNAMKSRHKAEIAALEMRLQRIRGENTKAVRSKMN